MVREFDPTERLDREVQRLIRNRLRGAAATLRAANGAAGPGTGHDRADCEHGDLEAAVHLARRHCKEVRALVRLLDIGGGQGAPLDGAVRAVAQTLAPVRDAHVAAALVARTCPSDDRAVEHVQPLVPDEHRRAVERAVTELDQAIECAAHLEVDDPAAALHRGLRRTYRHSRRAYARARRQPSPRRLHRWRTWNKRLWYQVRFLAVTAPSVLVPLAELLDVVGERLGDIHDLDVFVTSEPGRALDARQRDAIERERSELSERALRWGATIHAESPAAFADRLVYLVTAASEHGPEPAR